jgi:predicted AlkP superfamily pyrophosphatase or phosphodiesterase
MKILRFAALAAACLAPAALEAKPKLIVALSIDQFSGQLFREYRADFTGGLKRLSDGVVFAEGYQAHGGTETGPGHSTIHTGAHPARTGIVANDWIDFSAPRADKVVYCAEDERVPGSTSSAFTVSPYHLQVPALGDRMKAADPKSRVVAVAGKDRSAVMMGGHGPDQRWWWRKDRFVTHEGTTPAPIAAKVNASIAHALAEARPAMTPPPLCAPRNRAIDIGAHKTVGTYRFERAAGDAVAFSRSPELDAATLAMAAALAEEMKLGRGEATDLLAVSLSATDYVGHRYGTEGVEMCLQLTTLDADLGAFLAVLDKTGVDYVVTLTADHGGMDLPERARLQGVPDAARIDPALKPNAMGKRVAAEMGLADSVFASDWYLTPSVPAARRAEALAIAERILRASPQVAEVFTAAEVAAHPLPSGPAEGWSILDRQRASYFPGRSGDLMVTLKEHITPIADPVSGSVATHGSAWDHDRNVPILFWWKGIAPEDRADSAKTVDIMPTLASLIGLPVLAAEIDGHCLDIVAGPESNCRR